jgi:glycosyltransferase involved in cell wall biosynthesis
VRRPTTTADDVAAEMSDWPPAAVDAARQRMQELATVLDGGPPDIDVDVLARRIERSVDGQPDRVWLARSVLGGSLPQSDELLHLVRRARLDGMWHALWPSLQTIGADPSVAARPVQVVTGEVTVDVHHTASIDFVSGIQRVVRATVRRWVAASRPLRLVQWTQELDGLQGLDSIALTRLLGPGHVQRLPALVADVANPVLVPWQGVHVSPELTGEPPRSTRLRCMAEVGAAELSFVGYDCIPVTNGETVSDGMESYFAQYLAAVRHATRLAAISRASAEEFCGWRAMLASAGHAGPDIIEIGLPALAEETAEEDLVEARERFCLDHIPLVLTVGSHEPRKNHLAVLHAAELLWREGIVFNLLMVGSGAWKDERFQVQLNALRASGRPIETVRAMPDRMLWATYRLAHCVLLPSLNEGFGLPVAEGLAAGTPVVTSDFGSMRELAAPAGEPLGAIMVDPRDDQSIVLGLRRMLTDRALHERLRGEAQARELGTWERYAEELWTYLVLGKTAP